MIGDLYEPGSGEAQLSRLTAVRRALTGMTAAGAAICGAIAGIAVIWTLFTWADARFTSPWSILSFAVPAGAILGPMVVFGGGWLLTWIGRRLGGTAQAGEVRAALGRSTLVVMLALLLPPLLVLATALHYVINKRDLLQYRFLAGDTIVSPASYFLFHATADGRSAALLRLLPPALGLILLGATILFIENYARANRFSVWRATTAVLLATLAAVPLILAVIVALFPLLLAVL